MSRLFRKMLIAIVLLFGIMANATAFLSAWLIYDNLKAEFVSKGEAIAKSIALTSLETLLNRDPARLQALIDESLHINGVGYVLVEDSGGDVIAHTFVPAVPKEVFFVARREGRIATHRVHLDGYGDFIQIGAPILEGGGGYVRVGMDMAIIEHNIWAAIIKQEMLMVVLFCLSVFVFYYLIKGISRPLSELTRYAQRLREHDFSAHVTISSHDEIGLLARTMQSMAQELARSITELEGHVAEATTDLHGALAHMRAIMDNLADGLMVTDTRGQITDFNPAFLSLFGVSSQDVKGRKVFDIFPGPTAELAERATGCAGDVLTAEVNLAAGKIGKAVATSIQMDSEGRTHASLCVGAVIVVRDITAEKEVDKMKTEFISTVSHELRTPLTSVLGFAKMIKKKFTQEIVPLVPEDTKTRRTVEQLQSNLDIIVSEGTRLTDLVNDVLDIAKMESGRVEWVMRPLRVGELLEHATAANLSLFKQRGLKLVTDIEPDLPIIEGDRDRLIQVVINLLSNAVKFTEHGVVTVRVVRREKSVQVSVSDTGIGIAKKDLDSIFEKFKQAGDTLKEKPKGTGLGLTICRQIVERHGGRIWAESVEGQGSVFSFTIPVRTVMNERIFAVGQTVDGAVAAPVSIQSEHTNAGRILVVDDEPSVRAYLTQFLAEEGYEVMQAEDGELAVKLAKMWSPDLITMDLMMPGMDGATAIKLLRSDPLTKDIPVIVVSALPVREREDTVADATLIKPFNEQTLLETITSLIHGPGDPSRPCMVLKTNGEKHSSRLFMICTGRVSYMTKDELYAQVESGFAGTIFIPASVSHDADLNRLSRHQEISVVILPD
ncbi:ATP-binding protein [Desulfovibrio inopinatus]|uniref:ATP-binding protein n=1 Tax=Desulfovibrio inopinatus TaxID=102109 RepID=UPI00048377F5|nr:ATP-binding protein [Desulfovibrio inopinatus]